MLNEIEIEASGNYLEIKIAPTYSYGGFLCLSIEKESIEKMLNNILKQIGNYDYEEWTIAQIPCVGRPPLDAILQDSKQIAGILEELEEFCNELSFDDLELHFKKDHIGIEYGDFYIFTEWGNLQGIIERLIEQCKKYEELQELQERLEALIC